MKLESLMDFEWYNEPKNVIFLDKEMKIVAEPQTDFWQSIHHGIKKDNGHFFFLRKEGDFDLTAKWSFEEILNFNQCGLMIRVDERNWFKVSLMTADQNNPEIGTCLTLGGHSDWAGTKLNALPQSIFYKLKKKGDDFVCSYSLDKKSYIRLRQFYLKGIEPEIKVGVYICAPQQNSFEAILDEIEIKKEK